MCFALSFFPSAPPCPRCPEEVPITRSQSPPPRPSSSFRPRPVLDPRPHALAACRRPTLPTPTLLLTSSIWSPVPPPLASRWPPVFAESPPIRPACPSPNPTLFNPRLSIHRAHSLDPNKLARPSAYPHSFSFAPLALALTLALTLALAFALACCCMERASAPKARSDSSTPAPSPLAATS